MTTARAVLMLVCLVVVTVLLVQRDPAPPPIGVQRPPVGRTDGVPIPVESLAPSAAVVAPAPSDRRSAATPSASRVSKDDGVRVEVTHAGQIREDALLVLRWTEDGEPRTLHVEWTRDDDTVRLPASRVDVVAYGGVLETLAPGDVRALARSRATTLRTAFDVRRTIELALEDLPRLSIQVVGSPPPLDDLWARAVPADRVPPADRAAAFAPGGAAAVGGVDAVLHEDLLSLVDLDAGTWTIAVGRWGEPPVAFVDESVSEGLAFLRVLWPDPRSESGFTVLCLPPHDVEPIADASFYFEEERGSGIYDSVLRADGSYWIDQTLERGRRRVVEPVRVFVRSERWGARTIPFEEDRDHYTVRFEPPMSIDVRVSGGASDAWSARAISLERPPIVDHHASEFEDGIARLRVQPGRYRVELRQLIRELESVQRAAGTIAFEEVDAAAGALVVTLETSELHELVVRLPRWNRCRYFLRRSPPYEHGVVGWTDPSTRILRVPSLPSGEYEITVSGKGSMTVQVPGEPVDFVADDED